MNILFLSLLDYDSFEEKNIYTDLLREFLKQGHYVVAISPFERKQNKEEKMLTDSNGAILKIKIGNTQKVNFVEKGISTILLETQILSKAKRYLKNIKFDLILYTTPPVTVKRVVSYFKKRDNAITYLLLKDIFPQNAVDIGALSKIGLKGLIYKYFRNKECALYKISDYIGCMSEANVRYLLKENPYLDSQRIEVCPNSLEPEEIVVEEKDRIRMQYGIPADKKVVIYGGNLGKPQGVGFLLKCIEECTLPDIYFLIVGNGTEYNKIATYIEESDRDNITLIKSLPRSEYEILLRCCDIGVVLLDSRFTIPNFPSRMLSYMLAEIPILAATDINTDVRDVIESGQFGLWGEHGDVETFLKNITAICQNNDSQKYGKKAREYFDNHYTAKHSFSVIENRILRNEN